MNEEELKQGSVPPPTANEVAPEPKEFGIPSQHHYIMIAVIAVAVILIGGAVVWFYPDGEVAKVAPEASLFTSTMICESFENNVCKLRDGNVFDRGESIWIVTRIVPNTGDDFDVDMSFTTDIYSPNGEVTENFLGGHELKETISGGKYSEYWIEITTNGADLSGEYDIILTLNDNILGKEERIEEKFTLA